MRATLLLAAYLEQAWHATLCLEVGILAYLLWRCNHGEDDDGGGQA